MTSQAVPAALAIAGSDPSGGAGIQADLKTFTVIGIYGGAVITALTSQNTLGVTSCFDLPASFVKSQIEDVLSDLNVSHIKIGMVGNGEIAQAIGEALRQFKGEVVYDPVLRSSSGSSLFSEDDMNAISENIINQCTVLTPNIFELETITKSQCHEPSLALDAAENLLNQYPRLQAVCVKGGHINSGENKVTDYLVEQEKGSSEKGLAIEITAKQHPRISTKNSHGTGCTFASAFTAFHLLENNRKKAFGQTVHFLDSLISGSAPYHIGLGTGPLLHHLWEK